MADGTSQERAGNPARLRAVLVLGTAAGGVGVHVRSLARGLAARGVAVTVAGPAAAEEHFGFAGTGARFAPVEISAGPRPVDRAAVRALREACADAHVVHAHGLRAGLAAAAAIGRRPGRPGRTPLVLTLHNAVLASGPKGVLARVMEGRAVRAADVVLGASSDLVDRARALGAVDARLGPVGAPPPAARRDGRSVRAELGGGERPVVLAVGRLAPQKAYPVLLDAAAAWKTRAEVPLVVIAGDGPLRDALQGRIDAEDLPVRLLGHRDDVADLFAAADIAVLPSRWEARCLVAQEALAMGVPLVSTAVGGIPELVGDAAVLVDYGDAEALAEAVAALLDDPGRRASLAEAGRAQALTWPDEDDTVAQVLSVYEEPGPR
ncbi:glycosyltransferase family 4 protein [Yinghuangia sp. ASG 101]|uniref:glycosyltransferase family 4 protein n=1 Tax=Yinghuangia sp. ASG 101 TaxID=2896848 RepID=UPI001E592ADB|nr:glycosyltransferase family 4 protein [Yinghuangia sp. ASG 101]UGQ10251.1 glycosyltransferase family 4 protein [Yinghuangia sp. ASG 101]